MIEKIDYPNNNIEIAGYNNPYLRRGGVLHDFDLSHITAEQVKGGYAIQDPYITAELEDYVKSTSWEDFFVANGKHPIQEEYKSTFREWIESSQLNSIQGLEQFPHTTITNGTSESFQMFFMRHNNRRFKILKGDFIMHKVASNVMDLDWEVFTDIDINYGDAVIISLPFSDTASPYEHFDDLMRSCTEKNVPVLLDMAYFGCCVNVLVNLNSYPCIEDITFSLGKAFPIIGARAGIRFQREEVDDPVLFANQNGIVNNFACKIGNHCMQSFSADYIPYKYYDIYYVLCSHNDIDITNCVIFGLSKDEKFSSINRGNKKTRICMSNLVSEYYGKTN